MARLRTFVAVEASDPLRVAADRLIAKFSAVGADVRWIATHQLHLTLKFLGDVDEREIYDCCSVVKQVAQQATPFQLTCAGVGAFPNRRRPRTIWLGVKDEQHALRELQESTERAFSEIGLPLERRPYKGHLTLGRVKGRAAQLGELLEGEQDRELGTLAVEELVLFSSELGRTGPEYTALGRFPLA